MKTGTLASTLIALSSAVAISAPATASTPAVGIGEVIAELQSRYPGKVVAIELDDSGDKAVHYHVDMRFARAGVARLDIDASTLDIASREEEPLADESRPLVYAAALISSQVAGNVLAVKLDATNSAPVHYDVDVALPQGAIARLKVDASTGQIGWRSPAILAE